MSGSARNFRPSRDSTEDRQPPTKIRKENVYSGIERRSDYRVWSDIEENHSEFPPRESFHGNRYLQKDDRRKLERERSPGFDRWGGENKSRSPLDGWDPPSRGKCMSQGRSRSRDRCMSRSPSRSKGRARSRGRVRSRSRSRSRGRAKDRSPFGVHRRVSYGTAERNMTNSSSQPCKYFAAGNCRKGTRCNFFHPDNLSFRDGKYYENDVEPRRRGRAEYRDEVELSDNYERGNRNVSVDVDFKQQQPIISGNKPICKDFAVGKCHRDDCRFAHDDLTADDKWNDERRCRNHDERMKSWNGPTWDDHNKTLDTVKSSGWGEKVHDSAVGEKRGDDGRSYNFHDTKDTLDAAKSTGCGEGSFVNPRWHDTDLTTEESRGIDRWCQNSNEKSKVWNGPIWDDVKDSSDAAKSLGWGDNLVGRTDRHDPATAEHQSDGRRDRDRWHQNSNEKRTVWNGPTWDDVKDSSDAAKSLGRGDNLVGRMNIQGPATAGWGEGSFVNPRSHGDVLTAEASQSQGNDRWQQNSSEKSKVWNSPTWDDIKDSSDAVKSTGLGDSSIGRTNLQDPISAKYRSDNRREPDSYEVKDTMDATKSAGWGESSVMSMKLHDQVQEQGDERTGLNSYAKTEPTGLNSYAKTEPTIAPTLDDGKCILDSAKASGLSDRIGRISTFNHQIIADAGVPLIILDNPHEISTGVDDGKCILDSAKASGLSDRIGRISTFNHQIIADAGVPLIILDNPHEISTGVDEQYPILEAGAHQNAVRLSENSNNIPTFEDFNALNEVKVSEQNGKTMGSLPIPTSTDDSGVRFISNGHNIDLNVPFQNVNPETEAETLPKETSKQPSKFLGVSESVVNPKVSDTTGGKQEQGNVNAKIEDSNNNASKDEKAMRVFKIALVEFVKEILKPKWKEGQMSKDVHKTIVKKTVDKVSGTIPGDQIPNTQEKISQYLSFSKGKISKLIQAYVERFQKS